MYGMGVLEEINHGSRGSKGEDCETFQAKLYDCGRIVFILDVLNSGWGKLGTFGSFGKP